MKIFKPGSMMQEHLKRASAETKTAGKAPSTNFENVLKILMKPLRRSALVKCNRTLSDPLSSLVGRRHL
jgi:hypothetical protein